MASRLVWIRVSGRHRRRLNPVQFEWKIGPIPLLPLMIRPYGGISNVVELSKRLRAADGSLPRSRRWPFCLSAAHPRRYGVNKLLVFGSSLGPHPSRRWRDLNAGAVHRDWGTKGSLCWNLEEGRTKPLLSLLRDTRAHRLPTHKVRVGSLPNDHWQWLLGLHHRRPLTISIKGLVASGFCHAEPLSPLEAFLDNQWQDDVRDPRAQSYGLVVEHGFSRRIDVDSIQLP